MKSCKCCGQSVPDEIKTGAIKYHAWNGVEDKNRPVKCDMCGNSEYYKIIHTDRMIQRPKPRWDDTIWYWQCLLCLERHQDHYEAWENCKSGIGGRMCDECSENLNYGYPKMIPLDAVAPEVFNTDTGMLELGERIQ